MTLELLKSWQCIFIGIPSTKNKSRSIRFVNYMLPVPGGKFKYVSLDNTKNDYTTSTLDRFNVSEQLKYYPRT